MTKQNKTAGKAGRAVVKGLSWRAFAAFDTMVVAAVIMWWQTGHVGHTVFAMVGGIVGMELVTKTFLFTIHEMLWEGKNKAAKAAKATMSVFQFEEHAAGQVAKLDAQFKAARVVGEAADA